MTYVVDGLTAADWPQVADIYRQGIETGNATFETRVPTWDEWDAAHLPACRLAARDGERLVGWAALSLVSRRDCYRGVAEVSVYIAGDRRGQGIGEALLNALVRVSEEHGIWTLQGSTFPENVASLRLQEHCEFRIVGRRERIAQLRGVWRDTILTERRSARRLSIDDGAERLVVAAGGGAMATARRSDEHDTHVAASPIAYVVSAPLSNDDLNALFSVAWPNHAWRDFQPVLAAGLGYICAYASDVLVGFVNLAYDGGIHCFLLDTTVHPTWQHRGIGRQLVAHAANLARARGMCWLHVDYEPQLDGFYRSCGFQPTLAGLIRLRA